MKSTAHFVQLASLVPLTSSVSVASTETSRNEYERTATTNIEDWGATLSKENAEGYSIDLSMQVKAELPRFEHVRVTPELDSISKGQSQGARLNLGFAVGIRI